MSRGRWSWWDLPLLVVFLVLPASLLYVAIRFT